MTTSVQFEGGHDKVEVQERRGRDAAAQQRFIVVGLAITRSIRRPYRVASRNSFVLILTGIVVIRDFILYSFIA